MLCPPMKMLLYVEKGAVFVQNADKIGKRDYGLGMRESMHSKSLPSFIYFFQVGIGVSINRNADGGIRFNPNSVGVYLDSKRSYWGKPETPTSGGLNQAFSDRLKRAGEKSRGPGMWMLVNFETNQLWYAHPGMEAIVFDLPASFKGEKLYPHYQVWNSKSLDILHDKPLMAHNCTKSLFFNKDSFGGYDAGKTPVSNFLTDTTLKVVSRRWNDVNYAKLGGGLMDGQWVGGEPQSGTQVGIGVSFTPHAEGGIRFNQNSLGIYLDAKTLHWGRPEVKKDPYNTVFSSRLVRDPNGKPGMWIMVDYSEGILWYAHPYMKPISFPLPDIFKNKPLFPHYQVWNGKSIKLTTPKVTKILRKSFPSPLEDTFNVEVRALT